MKEKRKDPAIADRCQLEEALLESQQILEGIINAIPVRVFWKDENLVYLGCNTIFARDAGFTDPKDIIGKDDYQMGWRDQAELYRSDDRQVIESGRSKLLIEEPQTTPEGNTITLLTSKIPLRSSEGRIIGVLGTYMDITDRKRAEEALRESQKRFQALTETMNDFVWEMDARGAFTYCSPQINQIWGYKPEEMIGRRPFDLVIPEGRDEAIQAFRAILEPPRSFNGMVFKCRNRDGRIVVLEINGIPFIDIEGGLRGFRGIARDITERKRAEEEIRHKSQELQEKNDELNRFIYAVSHDLKSPLVTIQTFQGHLEQDIRSQDAERMKTDLGYIRGAADKMSRLLEELRGLSRVGRVVNPSEEAPLQAIVKEALDLVAGRIRTRGVRVDVTAEPVVLYGDRTRLVEVFQNLLDNAAKFMGDQRSPRIEIGVERAGEELALYVRDNGAGIDPEVQPLVFGLFHKLEPVAEGEGIGLALVKRIVELHGGRIWLESEGRGKGATFRFTLAKTKRGKAEKAAPKLPENTV